MTRKKTKAFVEYEDHKTAAQARRRLMSGKVKVWGNVGTVEWADPIEDPDPEVMAKVMTVGLKFFFVVLVGAAEGFREWRKTVCFFKLCFESERSVLC